MSKYKLTEHHLDNYGGVEKLTRDGFTKGDIAKAFHRETQGMCPEKSTRLYEKLYSRAGWERP